MHWVYVLPISWIAVLLTKRHTICAPMNHHNPPNLCFNHRSRPNSSCKNRQLTYHNGHALLLAKTRSSLSRGYGWQLVFRVPYCWSCCASGAVYFWACFVFCLFPMFWLDYLLFCYVSIYPARFLQKKKKVCHGASIAINLQVCHNFFNLTNEVNKLYLPNLEHTNPFVNGALQMKSWFNGNFTENFNMFLFELYYLLISSHYIYVLSELFLIWV